MTMRIGYDKPLYVLPFDHRATFSKTMFGWQGPLSQEQAGQIGAVKQLIYDAFKAAVAGGARSTAPPRNSRRTRTGAITCCFTSISTVTTALAAAPATRPAGPGPSPA
jgi:hypothetical protein